MLAEELDRFGDKLGSILTLKSGITGLWQVSGRSDIGFDGRVRLDLYYLENWSILMDIKILYRTIGVVIKRTGAY
jgi:undecaprenyl-phosphate galactose phosphotransferase